MKELIWIIVVIAFTLLVGIVIFLEEPARNKDISRGTHQCEIVGHEHQCISYSSRYKEPGCSCISNGVRIQYPNTYGE